MMRALSCLLLFAFPAYSDAPIPPAEQPVRMELGAGQVAVLTWAAEQATITGPGGAAHSFEVYGPADMFARYKLLRHDIDRDGTAEILVPTGIGYGGVNVFYVVLFWRGDHWWASPEIANPEFTGRHKGLIATAKSGPTYYRERWDLDADGTLFLRISQLGTFAGFDARRVMTPTGQVEAEMLVYETTDLFHKATPVFGVVQDDTLPLTATAESDEVVSSLRAGMGAELLRFDEHHWKVYLRASNGKTGWATPEGLTVDP